MDFIFRRIVVIVYCLKMGVSLKPDNHMDYQYSSNVTPKNYMAIAMGKVESTEPFKLGKTLPCT